MEIIRRYFATLATFFFILNLTACNDDVENLFSLIYLVVLSACAIVVLIAIAIALSIVSIIRAIVYHYRRWKEKRALRKERAKYLAGLSVLNWELFKLKLPDEEREIIERHLADIDARLAKFGKQKA